MLAVSLALMAAAIVAVYYSARVAMGFGRDVRSAIFRSVESFSQADINRFGTATLITRNTNDVQQVQQVILMALTMMITAPSCRSAGSSWPSARTCPSPASCSSSSPSWSSSSRSS